VEQPIAAGRPILAGQIKAISWSGSVVPQEAFSRTADVVGRIALVPMIPGEPVLPGKLAPIGATGGLSSIIPAGKRAISVRVNDVVGVDLPFRAVMWIFWSAAEMSAASLFPE